MRHWLPWSTKEFSQQNNLKFQLSSRDSMAAKYTVRQAVELLFDDEFGLSDGDISEEEGEEVYSYRGGESLAKKRLKTWEERWTLEVTVFCFLPRGI